MSHHITWIIDNDPKGKTSRGTLFGCRFKIDGIEHLKSYHLLDQIENNLVTIKNQKENMRLAGDILKNTKNNYLQGLASLTDL